jgi:succinate dehydrogenase/fumarate reductase flavoprotein subunit
MVQNNVVVVGAGMAGLVTAVRAQQLGAQVTLVEKGTPPGGSLALSGGTLWCARTDEDLRRLVPRGHPVLGPLLVEDFPAGVEWLRSIGATLTPLESKPDRFVYLTDPNPRAFVQLMVEKFLGGGGTLLTDTSAVGLRTDAHGTVTGVTIRSGNGPRSELDASAVILATGGFQANREMMARYYGRWSDRLIVRGNPHSTGDGWSMAQAIGAGTSAAMGSFYGHLLPAPPAQVPTNDFIAFTQYHSEKGVLVNSEGRRFADESLGDETNSQAVARQNEAIAYLIFDDVVYREFAVRPGGKGSRASDTFFESQALGAPSATAPTLERLADTMWAHGLHAPNLLATLAEYNEAVEAGTAAYLPIPRRDLDYPVVNPPFYALAVTPGVTFTLGGVPINQDAQVLDRSGAPIPGLYAAGADAGGIHNEQYAGGLCLGLVFGRRAAGHAVSGASSSD